MFKFFFPISLFLTGTFINAQDPLKEKWVALENVNLIPMTEEKVIRDQTVLVYNDQIVEIGPDGSIDIPDGAEIIDGENGYLMPGLSDMHVHVFSEEELLLYLINGVTTVRNMWGWDSHLEWKRKIETDSMLGPSLYTSGRIVDGHPARLRGSAEIGSIQQAKEEVRTQVEAGYDFIKVYDRLEAPLYAAIVTEAKKHLTPVAGHVPEKVGLQLALMAGQNSIEHLNGIIPVTTKDSTHNWSAKLEDEMIEEIVKFISQFEAWVTPTLVVYERGEMSAAASREFLKRAELDYLPSFYKRFCCESPFDPHDDLTTIEKEIRTANRLKIVRSLHQNGVPLLLGTDTGNRFVLPGFDIHRELQLLAKAGLSPYEALKTGTVNPSKYLGIADVIGTIEKGKIADLILIAENPLDNIEALKNIHGVMRKGYWASAEEIQLILNKIKDENLRE